MRGRDTERGRIEQLLAGARQGTSGVLLLHGEAGIGKTALLDHAAGRADGLRVLRVEGIESEMELAYGGLHQLFLPVLDLVDALPAPRAAALRAVLGLSGDGVRDRFTVGLAVLALLAEAAADGPLLCLVDDAQWLDQPSVDMLTFAARRLRAEGVVMLFAVRDGAPGATVRGLPALLVEALGREAAAELLPGLPPYVAERVIEESGGNPLALIELAAALGRRGRGDRPDRPPRRAARAAEPAGARGRPAGGHRGRQPGDRRAAVPEPPHRRAPPVPGVPQAGRRFADRTRRPAGPVNPGSVVASADRSYASGAE